jgi:uncharacterized protein YkwD
VVLLAAFLLSLAASPLTSLAAPSHGRSALTQGVNATKTWKPESEECALLARINVFRLENGLGTLTMSTTLGAAAEFHSRDMAKNGYFGHTLADGTTWAQNIANHGYPTDSSRAENIAAGMVVAETVLFHWTQSPDHLAKLKSPKYNAIGIGRYKLDGSRYTYYWTADFGSRVDQPYACPGQPTTGGGEPRGTQLVITGGGRTSSSTASTLAYDGDTTTSWYTTKGGLKAGYVYFDLGVTKSVRKIDWIFARAGAADSYEIQVSTDKQNWTKVSSKANTKAGVWQTLKLSKQARYVRFYFKNPNGDAVLGYLAEVKIFA